MIARQSPSKSDRETLPSARVARIGIVTSPSRERSLPHRCECDAIRLPLEILLKETARCRIRPALKAAFAVDEVLQQSAPTCDQKPMLEFVLETPETAITRRVTIFGTGFHKRQSPMKEIAPAVCDLTGESGAARQGVVEEYLCLKPARSGRREPGRYSAINSPGSISSISPWHSHHI